MEQGYIKLFRKFTNWEWYKDQNTKDLFLHLLITANHKKKKWQGIEIERGQVITSLQHLVDELGEPFTIQKIRTSLKKLENTENITRKSTNKYMLITITKYSDYQDKEEKATRKATNEQQTNNKQITTNKNEKNDKNEKNIRNYNTTTNNIYQYIESNFSILLSPTIVEKVESWLLFYTEDILQYAVDISVLNGKRTVSYFEGILKNWKGEGFKTLLDIKEAEVKRKPKGEPVELEEEYDWLNE